MRWLANLIVRSNWFNNLTAIRTPDVVIGGHENPYMLRWWLIPKNRFFGVYLHYFLRSDDDRALHDHPFDNISFLLQGIYTEHTILAGGIHKRVVREAGDLKFRTAESAHRIELTHGSCWTLFVVGPRRRRWGFLCPKGWVHWEDFTATDEVGSSVYRGGCDA